MADDFCERDQLPKAICAHCRADRSVVTAVLPDFAVLAEMASERDDTGPAIEAQWEGTCRGCGERWSPGDLIGFSEGEDRFVCVDCLGA